MIVRYQVLVLLVMRQWVVVLLLLLLSLHVAHDCIVCVLHSWKSACSNQHAVRVLETSVGRSMGSRDHLVLLLLLVLVLLLLLMEVLVVGGGVVVVQA